jgi:predicted metal-dependent hydrolase
MTSAIHFGSKQIDFRLEYSNRKTLGITVTPDLSVLVKAPVDTSFEKVKEKLRKKAPWIIRQQSFFLTFHPKTPARKFIAGETHFYLGRQYRLKIISEKLKVKNEEVKLKGQFLEIFTQDKSKIKVLVEDWYLSKAKDKFPQIAKPLFEEFATKHNLSLSTFHLSLRNMPTRWGSCTPKGKIILNPELIKAPKGCIEYVIIHELCHLVHHDHTQKFIDLQAKEMQDWEKWKMKLEKLLA